MIWFRSFISKKKNHIILFVLVLLSCEGITRVFVRFAPERIRGRVVLSGTSRYIPHHYINYCGNPNHKEHNSLGFRGPEIGEKKGYRILLLGGSTTYTTGVDSWTKDVARCMEKELDAEVINCGMMGWSSWESMINFAIRGVDLKPDMIIVYHGINDVHTRMVDPDYFTGDNSGRRSQWDDSQPVIFKSMLVRLLSGGNCAILDKYVGTKHCVSGSGVKNEKIGRIGATIEEVIQKNSTVYSERNLKNIIGIAREHGIRVVLATFAYCPTKTLMKKDIYRQAIAEHNDTVRAVAGDYGVELYDFAAEMPIDEKYWKDGVHVNEAGSRLKGKLFAGVLR